MRETGVAEDPDLAIQGSRNGLRETGEAEVEDLAIQDRALRIERRIAERAKERPVTQAAQCRAKCLSIISVLPSTAHHITCHSPAESVIRR